MEEVKPLNYIVAVEVKRTSIIVATCELVGQHIHAGYGCTTTKEQVGLLYNPDFFL
jgi:hypothetical protein